MTYFDAIGLTVRVTEHPMDVQDPRVRRTLFEDTADLDELGTSTISVDELLKVAHRFPYGELNIATWFSISTNVTTWSQGGDGATLQLILEFQGELKDVAYDTLAMLFAAYLMRELGGPRDDAD